MTYEHRGHGKQAKRADCGHVALSLTANQQQAHHRAQQAQEYTEAQATQQELIRQQRAALFLNYMRTMQPKPLAVPQLPCHLLFSLSAPMLFSAGSRVVPHRSGQPRG